MRHRPKSRHLRNLARLFCRDTRGVALLEFGLLAPIFIIMLIGSIELSNYLLTIQKLESSATQILSIINQGNNVTKESLDSVFATLPDMMGRYPLTNSNIIVSQIKRPATPASCQPVVIWQYMKQPAKSKIGDVGQKAVTGKITVPSGDNLLSIEITGKYSLYFLSSISTNIIGDGMDMSKRRFEHPRYGGFDYDPNTGLIAKVPCKQ